MPLNQDVSKQSPGVPAPAAGHNPHQLIRALSMKRGMTQQDLVPTKPNTKKPDAAAAPSPARRGRRRSSVVSDHVANTAAASGKNLLGTRRSSVPREGAPRPEQGDGPNIAASAAAPPPTKQPDKHSANNGEHQDDLEPLPQRMPAERTTSPMANTSSGPPVPPPGNRGRARRGSIAFGGAGLGGRVSTPQVVPQVEEGDEGESDAMENNAEGGKKDALNTSGNSVDGDAQLLDVLRINCRKPREDRVWGVWDGQPAKALGAFKPWKMMPLELRRRLAMVCEVAVYRRGQVVCVQGREQESVLFVLGGTLSVRVHPSGGLTEGFGSTGDDGNVVEASSFGEELRSAGPGDTVGASALMNVSWGTWGFTCVSSAKVELLVIKRSEISASMEASFLTWFDTETVVSHVEEFKAGEADGPSKERSPLSTPLDGVSRGSAGYQAISSERGLLVESLRRIPFFRQLGPSVVRSMTHRLEVLNYPSKTVLWDFRRVLSKEVGHEKALASENKNETYLHVLIGGKAWAFKKDFGGMTHGEMVGLIGKTMPEIDVLWGNQHALYAAYGRCECQFVPGDSFGFISGFQECTLVLDAGASVMRIKKWDMTLDASVGRSIVHMHQSLRECLAKPNTKRSEPERRMMLKLLQSGSEFFARISTLQAKNLLERSVFRRFQAGDAIVRQGDEGQKLFVVLNGIANVHRNTELDAEVAADVWKIWEALRDKTQHWELGSMQGKVSIGDSIGEQEVVELTRYTHTVVATEDLEAIEIDKEAYRHVLWDLCDGEAMPVDRLCELVEMSDEERGKQGTEELLKMLSDSDFLMQFPRDLQRWLCTSMSISHAERGDVVTRQGEPGEHMLVVISGSVAMHKKDSVPGEGLGGDANLGECKRVMGIGDSFGELSFVQGRTYPATCVARAKTVMIRMERKKLSPVVESRMLKLVEHPRNEVVDEVFAKDIEDRNDNDVMILVNFCENNKFFKNLSFPVIEQIAHVVRRQNYQAGCLVKRLKIGGSLEDEEENDQDEGAEAKQEGDGGGEGGVGADGNAADDMNNIITDTTVYIVNRGSLITTPFNPKLPISVSATKNQGPSQPSVSSVGSSGRGVRDLEEEYMFYNFMSCIRSPERIDPQDASFEAVAAFNRRCVAVDSEAILLCMTMHLPRHDPDNISTRPAPPTDLCHLTDILSINKHKHNRFGFLVELVLPTEFIYLCTELFSEGDELRRLILAFQPLALLRTPPEMQGRVGRLFLKAGPVSREVTVGILDGWLCYSTVDAQPGQANLDMDWYPIGHMKSCVACSAVTLPPPSERSHGLVVSFSSGRSYTMSCVSNGDRAKWVASLQGMIPSQAIIPDGERMVPSGDENKEDDASRVLQSLVARVQRIKRSKRMRAKQRLTNRPEITASPRDGKEEGEVHQSFAMQGSAFCYNGIAKANEDCEVLILGAKDWASAQRFETAIQLLDLAYLLQRVPELERASKREINGLCATSQTGSYGAGETILCSELSRKHVFLIKDGQSVLRQGRGGGKKKKTGASKKHDQVKRQCTACSGSGTMGGTNAGKGLSDKVALCKECKGTGYIVEQSSKGSGMSMDVLTLQRGSLLRHGMVDGDFDDYEIHVKTSLRLVFIKREAWDEVTSKQRKLHGAGMQRGNTMIEETVQIDKGSRMASMLAQNQQTMDRIFENQKAGKMIDVEQVKLFPKELTLEQRASLIGVREYSKRARELKVLLGERLVEEPFKKEYVTSEKDVKRKTCSLAPASTIKNPFMLGRMGGGDGAAGLMGEQQAKEALLESMLQLGPGSLNDLGGAGGMALIPVLKLSGADVDKAHNLKNQVKAALGTASRGIRTGFDHRIRLPYGNAYVLNERQARIFEALQELYVVAEGLDEEEDDADSLHPPPPPLPPPSSAATNNPGGSPPRSPPARGGVEGSNLPPIKGSSRKKPRKKALLDLSGLIGEFESRGLYKENKTSQEVCDLQVICKSDVGAVMRGAVGDKHFVGRSALIEIVARVAKILQVPLDGKQNGHRMVPRLNIISAADASQSPRRASPPKTARDGSRTRRLGGGGGGFSWQSPYTAREHARDNTEAVNQLDNIRLLKTTRFL